MIPIYVSVGHSGGDGGARANNTCEFDECLKVSNDIKKMLESKNVRCEIVPTNLVLTERINWINHNVQVGSLVIELHLDSAPGATGSSIFYYEGFESVRVFSENMLAQYIKVTGMKSRGTKIDSSTRHGRLGIIRDTKSTAILWELGFIQEDLETVRTKSALGITQAILSYLQLPLMTAIELQQWEKLALDYAKNAINFSQENPRSPMTRVEVAETMRKFELYIQGKYNLK